MRTGTKCLDMGTQGGYVEPEIPPGVERTCPVATPWREIRVGDVIRYQTEQMPTEITDRVVRKNNASLVVESGRCVPQSAWIVKMTASTERTECTETTVGATGGSPSEPKETAMPKKTKWDYANVDRAAVVAAVNALIDAGDTAAEACAKVGPDHGITLRRDTYYYWRNALGLPRPTTPVHKLQGRGGDIADQKKEERKAEDAATGSAGILPAPPAPAEEKSRLEGGAPSGAADPMAVAKAARGIASDVCALLEKQPNLADVEAVIKTAASAMPEEIQDDVAKQAGYLVAAWQRGWAARAFATADGKGIEPALPTAAEIRQDATAPERMYVFCGSISMLAELLAATRKLLEPQA